MANGNNAQLTPEQRRQYQRLAVKYNQDRKMSDREMIRLREFEQKRLDGGVRTLLTRPLSGVSGGTAAGEQPAEDRPLSEEISDARPIKDPGSVYDVDVKGEEAETLQQIKFQNAETTTPLGGTKVTVDEEGNPKYESTLSDDQQAILDQGEDLTLAGQGKAGEIVEGYEQFGGVDTESYKPFGFDASEEGRQRIEDLVYDRLTRRFDRNEARELEQAEQKLFQQGISYSDNPKSKYQKVMGGIKESYDEREDAAQGQAVMYAGDEMSRLYGMDLGTHQQGMSDMGQFYGQDLTTHQQGVSDIQSLQGAGTGLMLPNLPGYSAPSYDVQDPSAYIYAGKELKQGNKEIKLAKDQLAQESDLAHQQLALQREQLALARQPAAPQAPAPPSFP